MVKLHPCGCSPGKMMRVPRDAWMRLLFPSRALYECGGCGRRFLTSVADQTNLGLRSQAERLQSLRDEAASAAPKDDAHPVG